MEGQSTTHDLDIRDDIVIKRYRSWDRREPHREWRALSVLAEYAPGLAPTPVRADVDGDPPMIVMSRMPGTPLRGTTMTEEQTVALAEALTKVHSAVPTEVVRTIQPAAWGPAAAVDKARLWAEKQPDLGTDPRVADAYALGTAWLASADPDHLTTNPMPPTLGSSDNNSANYLWNAAEGRVHIVDWEDSGQSDRAFEIAELIEHISHIDDFSDREGILDHIHLDNQEIVRVRDFRRVLALGWFLMLGPAGPFASRNPPDTLAKQADRILCLFG
ncbi:phosphotransferase family protein [Nonomuraea sp. NPDC050556]|uniref:phosphotransferase family protein n=1 Tax=Nonomuraea sp. NPDC050556 TaxID=3364369 RepID=UPI0037AEEE5C